MIKLIINNNATEENIQSQLKYFCDDEFGIICELKPYDTEKWKNGRIYEFNTLKEVGEFIRTCDIELTDESYDTYTYRIGYEVNIDYLIDVCEDNLIELSIYIQRHSID